jgi:hypothetical protein
MVKEKDNKGEAPKRADKMAKPSKSVRDFNFPAHGITVQATGIREAESKLENLKHKQKEDD